MSSTAIFNTGLAQLPGPFLRAPNYVNANVMTLASSAASIPIPTNANYVRLAGTEPFFATFGSTGVTSGGSTAGAASEYVSKESGGIYRNIQSTLNTTAISVLSTAAACTVTATWWSI